MTNADRLTTLWPRHPKSCRCDRCFMRLLNKAIEDYLGHPMGYRKPVDQRALDRRITR